MRNTQMKNETTVKIAGETERETALCDSRRLCRHSPRRGKQEGDNLLFIGEGVTVPDGVDLAGIVRVQVFAV